MAVQGWFGVFDKRRRAGSAALVLGLVSLGIVEIQ